MHSNGNLRSLGALLLAALASRVVPAVTQESGPPQRPIILSNSGGFHIGGKVLHDPERPNQTLTCDHGYVEYFKPWQPRKTSLFLWHSSSTQVWQNRWDGGEGFKDKFLRREYPVYMWDAPRLGRASWNCEATNYTPGYRDQGNFVAWNFGPAYGQWWPGVQFPTEDAEAWSQATGARYPEYDTVENVHLQSQAAAVAADSGKVGHDIVYLTNSAAGLRALMTTIKSNGTNIKGIVAYEPIGMVFPDSAGVQPVNSGFGPLVVPSEDFMKLTKLKGIQFVWGDNRDESFPFLEMSRQVADLINKNGGNADVFRLGDEAGLKGSTHIAFADMDNEKIAEALDTFLAQNKLDDYA